MTQTLTPEHVLTEIDSQIRKLVPDYTGEITLASRFKELDMDSLNQVDLLAALEIAFEVEVPDDDVATITQVRDLVDLVMTLRERG